MSEIKIILLSLVALWILWYATGGPARAEKDKPYLTPATPYEQSRAYGK
ncbi:MAG: hypothetical protein WCO58_02845 [bacterium]